MKILVELSGNGFISCCREQCEYKMSCANYRGASYARMENGFSPQFFEENGQFYCGTVDEIQDFEVREPFPARHMGKGAVHIANGNFIYPQKVERVDPL